MAPGEYWGVQRFIETEICVVCDEFPCRCAELIDEYEEMQADGDDTEASEGLDEV
jgi:hypothetical protein